MEKLSDVILNLFKTNRKITISEKSLIRPWIGLIKGLMETLF